MNYCPNCLHPAHVGVCPVRVGTWRVGKLGASDALTTADTCCCVATGLRVAKEVSNPAWPYVCGLGMAMRGGR